MGFLDSHKMENNDWISWSLTIQVYLTVSLIYRYFSLMHFIKNWIDYEKKPHFLNSCIRVKLSVNVCVCIFLVSINLKCKQFILLCLFQDNSKLVLFLVCKLNSDLRLGQWIISGSPFKLNKKTWFSFQY